LTNLMDLADLPHHWDSNQVLVSSFFIFQN
jgi:hypothetical protein